MSHETAILAPHASAAGAAAAPPSLCLPSGRLATRPRPAPGSAVATARSPRIALPQAVLQRRHSVQPKATLRVKRLSSTRAPIGRFSAPGLENDAPRPLNRLIVPRHLPRAAPGPDIARSGAAPPRGAWAPAGRCATLAAIRGAAPDVGLTEVRAMATMAELR